MRAGRAKLRDEPNNSRESRSFVANRFPVHEEDGVLKLGKGESYRGLHIPVNHQMALGVPSPRRRPESPCPLGRLRLSYHMDQELGSRPITHGSELGSMPLDPEHFRELFDRYDPDRGPLEFTPLGTVIMQRSTPFSRPSRVLRQR